MSQTEAAIFRYRVRMGEVPKPKKRPTPKFRVEKPVFSKIVKMNSCTHDLTGLNKAHPVYMYGHGRTYITAYLSCGHIITTDGYGTPPWKVGDTIQCRQGLHGASWDHAKRWK